MQVLARALAAFALALLCVQQSGAQVTGNNTAAAGALPPGGSVGQCVVNTAPGAGGWNSCAAGAVSTTGTPASGNLTKFSAAATITNGDLSGDCTTAGTLASTCTKTSGVAFGTFATANAATPPAIGGTTPAAGTFSSLKDTGATGSTQCLHVDTTGAVTGTGSDCGAGGSTAFSAVTAGTNGAALVVGTGGSLGTSGTGSITASALVAGIALGTPASGVLTNETGLPLTTGVTGNLPLANIATIATQTILGNGSGSTAAPVALTLTGNVVATATGLGTSQPINAQVGTSYAMLSSDAGKFMTFSNAAAVAVSLSVASAAGFTAGYSFDVQNLGVGAVTITPTTSTINGAATLVITQNKGCSVTSDGTNYQVSACTAIAGGAVVTATGVTGPTNDYSPAGFGPTTGVLYLTPAAGGSTYNGLAAQSSLQQVYIVNAEAAGGADNILLANQSASDTTAANRFLTSATVSLAIPPGGRVLCVYLPSAVSRWSCQ